MISVPTYAEKDPSRLVIAIRELANGRSNAVGTFTLAASTTQTVVTAINCGAGSVIGWMPTTANAAAALATTYCATVANGSFTLTHASSTGGDRTFLFLAVG